MTEAVTALVPMKGESERVRAKNTRDVGGVPLFHHVLGHLLGARRIGQVLVNTDSELIAEMIKESFPTVVVLRRSAHLLGAKVPMTPIIAHDLAYASYPHFLQTHATTPLLSSRTIDEAIGAYFGALAVGFDSLCGVSAHHTRFYRQDGSPVNHDPDVMVPSQDMPPLFEDNSTMYINSVAGFFRRNNRIGSRPLFYVTPRIESLDIDTEEDLEVVQAVMSARGRV